MNICVITLPQFVINNFKNLKNILVAKLDYKYINAILTKWHEAGCKTIDGILEYEKHSKAEKENKKSAGHRPRPKAEAEAPKYGNFDPREALAAALSRSYGDDNDK